MSRDTLADVLLDRCERRPDDLFVTIDGTGWTASEIVRRAASLGAALRSAGLDEGDRVLMMLDNGLPFLDAWFGCALHNLVMVPLNTRLRGPLLEDVVRRTGALAVISDPDHVGALLPCLDDSVKLIAVTGGALPEDRWMNHEDLVADETPPTGGMADGSDVHSIIFTSGTTGPAKGVVLTNAHCYARSRSYVDGLRLDASDVMYSCLPLFHNNAQMATILPSLIADGRAVVSPRFSVSRFWSEIRDSRSTRFTVIGRMANLLLAAPVTSGDRDHSVRTACIVPPPRGGDEFASRFGLRVVSQYYGATEMIPMPPDLAQKDRAGTCGRAGDAYECAVLDPAGKKVSDGEIGELAVRPRCPSGMMREYLDMPVETLHAFRGLWFHTGDAVRRDSDGYFYLVGRLKDFIRHKGENISATEVERVVSEHPAILDVAAVGEPDDWGEEEVVLYVEVDDPTVSADALLEYCGTHLPDFMVPTRVHIVDQLPRNALGRIEKFRLRPAAS